MLAFVTNFFGIGISVLNSIQRYCPELTKNRDTEMLDEPMLLSVNLVSKS